MPGAEARGGAGLDRIGASEAPGPPGLRGRLAVAASGLTIGLVLALAIALGGLGMGGGSAAPVATADPGWPVIAGPGSVSILSPGDQSIVVDSPLELTAIASRPLGVVHAELALGAMVLGAADATVERAGQFRIVVPLTGPRVTGQAQLTVTLHDARGSVVLDTRTVRVCTGCV